MLLSAAFLDRKHEGNDHGIQMYLNRAALFLSLDLEIALRSAWHATMILQNQSIRQAEGSLHNRTRQVLAAVLGQSANEVTVISRKRLHTLD
jgi:hypothetical protein